MCELLVTFDKSMNEIEIAKCYILCNMRGQVVLADKYIKANPDNEVALGYKNELINIMKNRYWTTDVEKINYFTQKIGEFIFYIICVNKELFIDRIKEQNDKNTPDFKIEQDHSNIFFEIKTPTYVCSIAHIKSDLEESLNNTIKLEHKIKNGAKAAFAEMCIDPYTYDNSKFRDKEMTKLITTLIDKAKNNLKKTQFEDETFLVYNLSVLGITQIVPSVLCPVYQDNFRTNCLRSGELWSLGFISQGTPIYNEPEFEGASAMEGPLEDKCGILVDDNYRYVKGIIFMLYDGTFHPDDGTQLYGLLRNKDNFGHDESIKLFKFLVGKNWNDEKNSNGYWLLPKHYGDKNVIN